MKISIEGGKGEEWLIIDGDDNTIEFARHEKPCIELSKNLLKKYTNPDGTLRILMQSHYLIAGDNADKLYDDVIKTIQSECEKDSNQGEIEFQVIK